ncbi:HYR domain-containing protein [uncultured Maribacter sp.]|uniref:HYR domain-containing protein n=1 Tax=uncultured Maribacter sp. TaxID=431308 RepID=UPI0030DB02D3|tara:strand:- start:9274 stop:14493 length:5220 start_codon:yes stop_codon:yes gene_type:complete
MKKITLLWVLLISTSLAFAQTSLTAGDIAFIGVNTDGVSDPDDNFAFVLLKDIEANTTITFTDRGWNDGTGFFEAVGDGDFTWTASTALSVGEVVVLDFSNLSPTAAAFTVLGDQLFAIQGSIASPTFIAGLHFNVVTGTTDDANWDGAATGNTTSALPDALTNGDTAIRLSGPGGVEQDNFQFSCATATCPLAGTPEEIRAIVHNLSNWVSNNDNVYPGTVDVSFGTPTVNSSTINGLNCPEDQNLSADGSGTAILPDYTSLVTINFAAGGTGVDGGGGFGGSGGLAALAILAELEQSPAPGTALGVGTTTVTMTSGSFSCSFEVVVNPIDNTPPVISACPESFEFDSFLSAECGGIPDWVPPTATDNLPGLTLTSNYKPGDLFPFGITEVVYTATDAAGNKVECKFMVTVNDEKAPAPICINGLTVTLDATTGLQTIAATDFIASPITDPCGDITYTISRATDNSNTDVRLSSLSLNCDDNETTIIRIWAEDVNGNSDYCETYVVVDKSQFNCPTPPVITCPDDITIKEGESTAPADTGAATATGGAGNVIIGFSDSVSADGTITRTWTATDENLMSSSCEQTIKVDPLSRVIVTKDVIGIGSNPDDQFYFFYNTSISNELGNFYLSESGINSPEQEGGSFSFSGAFLIQVREENLPDKYSISDIQFNSEKGTSTISLKTNNEIQVNVASGDNVSIKFINTYVEPCSVSIGNQPDSVIICAGDPLSFDVGATGTGTLSYQWQVDTGTGFEDLGAPSANSQLNFAYMEIGGDGNQYRVIVTSDNNTPNDNRDDCTATSEAATLTVNAKPIVEITGKDSYCHDGNGVVLDAGAGFASYLWSPGGQTTQTITALSGIYTVTVTNEFSCETTSEAFTVLSNQQMTCSIEQNELATNHLTEDGVATVHPTGGTIQYTYLWDNGETTQTATTLTYGIHSVTVTDSNGCETKCQIDIAKELYCWTNLINNVSVAGGNDGAASVKGNGGYRPYTFKWDDGSTDEVNNSLTAGTHYVTITDASGATSQCSVTIFEPSKEKCSDFISTIEQDKLATNHVTEDGVATVYPKGGSGQYTYLWDNGETTQTAIKLTYGVHTVTVTDSQGCETSCQINIAKELYCWTNLISNVSDYGSNDGAARARGNGGYRPYTFKWDDGSTNEVNNQLSAGKHYVTIIDATGATSQCSVTISQPNEEVCDGVDNDGDGKVDEGFDQDGDGIADCFDICDKGDDHVDMDNDGIPDACDDDICVKDEEPMTECYQTAVWDQETCSWIISGVHPMQPVTECYQTAEWNGTTCTWDIIDGQRPEMPMTLCYQTAVWSDQICDWEINGEKPLEPMTECYQTAEWNGTTCTWDILDGQPEMPMTLCYQTAVWSDQICDWEITGEKPLEPMTECYEAAVWNEATCEWDIEGVQSEMPMTLCYQTAVWSDQICDWEITGEKPLEPMTKCYETATWNEATCEWDIEGLQPEIPMTQCQETAVWNELTCTWDIIENNNDCGTGTIDKCETAFARSTDESVRTCFLDIPNVSGNRWGWTNVFPSTNGTYNMDLYAAAGQCTISNGALVGNVEVIYTDGTVEVTVSTLSGYKMTVAQLYVGTEILPTDNNGRFTTAPGQYPYSDTVEGDFNTFTFESVNVGNPGNFYVVLHADVCPNVTVPSKTASVKLELTAYPVPFKDYINLKIESPLNMNGTLSLYNGIGQKLQDFGSYTLKKGDNEINLNTGEIPRGLYFIRMTSVYGTETLKILRK